MVRHLYVVGNYLDHQCLRDAVYLVALQNQDALNRGAVLTFRVVHQLHQLVFVVDAELRHQLKMDCYQDVALPVLLLLRQYFHLKFFLPLLGLMGAQRFLREQPLALLNQRQVQRLIQRLIQDLPQRSSSRQSSLQQLS
jgi:hypothetical protein